MSARDPTAARNFGQFIGDIEDGGLHNEASRQLRDLVSALQDDAAIRRSKSHGTLTLTIDVTLDEDVVEVRGEIKIKTPKPMRRGRSLFWVGEDGDLTRRNPAQGDLALRDVSASPGAIRTVV